MAGSSVIDNVDYGPLGLLVGVWQGDRGVDIAPEPEGTEENAFYEKLSFEAIGIVTNAESQVLAALLYHQVVRRKSNDEVLHNQTGYWTWDRDQHLVVQSLVIPRGVCLIAGGKGTIDGDHVHIQVHAGENDGDWSILQAPFMRDNARTVSFVHRIDVEGHKLAYQESTVLDIYGKRFDHTDENRLERIS